MLVSQSQWLFENKLFTEYKVTKSRDNGFAYQMRKYSARKKKGGGGGASRVGGSLLISS